MGGVGKDCKKCHVYAEDGDPVADVLAMRDEPVSNNGVIYSFSKGLAHNE